jgi:hypothetical protein
VFPELAWVSALEHGRDFDRVRRQIVDVGACEHPIWLRGQTLVRAIESGLVVARFGSDGAPLKAVPIRCMNRRALRCGPCSRLYKDDAFWLAMCGIVGGKGVPVAVREHPMVFVTVTAPSFGAVHRAADPDNPKDRCRARRDGPVCPHGRVLSCVLRHGPDDLVVGQPLCCDCYDYPGHVLFNALAPSLWGNLVDTVYHRLAAHSDERRSGIRRLVRVEYCKVAEYQARGVVHFHAIVRLDGPREREPPPVWASPEVLAAAVRSAAGSVSVAAPSSDAVGDVVVRFGAQVDVRPIDLGAGDAGLDEVRVSRYVAKYTTKGTEVAHGPDRAITHASQIDLTGRTPHVRALMRMAWRLGGLPEFAGLNIRHWVHMLGYGGHPITKSWRFSTTHGRLRAARAEYKAGGLPEVPGGVVVERDWVYVSSGYPSQSLASFADGVREDLEEQRELAREASERQRQVRGGGGR